MCSGDGSLVLAYNGEVYNFREMRAELEEAGHRFVSRTDTEVVLHAYQEWGVEALGRFNGMFALALYDLNLDRLLLARDRFGEKPLYYFQQSGSFLLSSELKGLIAHPDFAPVVAPEMLSLYLVHGYIPHPHTIFTRTFKLPPGHCLLVDGQTHQTQLASYWNPLTPLGAQGEGEGLDQAVERLDELLTSAVRRQLVADVPVGAFLSGGVDSALIVSQMAKLQANLKTFSIGFADDQYDEAPHARAIASHLGCEHYEHYVTPQEARAKLLELPGIYDEPFADSSAIPTYLVSQFARHQVKVVLTGDAGDELFGGYTTYPRLAQTAPLLRLPAWLRHLMSDLLRAGGPERWRRHAALLGQREAWAFFLYLSERSVAKLPDVIRLFPETDTRLVAVSSFAAAFRSAQPQGLVQSALFADLSSYLVDDNLAKVDRASMAVSLETRVPFLDVHVAEFALGLSARAKLGPWQQDRKRLLRQLLAQYLPRPLFERPKRGFSVPMANWLRHEMRWLLEDYLGEGRLRREGLFDPGVVAGLVREHLSGQRDREAILWALIFWQLWREGHRV
jgi:asparagine synthase (glutamine-hydrolysing)